MKIINASLMCGPPENGYTSQMRKIATDGYWPLLPNNTTFNKDLVELCTIHKPDMVFLQIQAPGIIDPMALRQCKDLGTVIFNFNGDIREVLPSWHYDIAPYCDSMLFTNMLDVQRIRQAGFVSDWLELGFDPERYKTWPNIPVDRDVIAHFNHYGSFPLSQYRLQIAERLRSEFGNNFAVYGTFPGAAGNLNSDQIEESKNYMRAKIAINCSHFSVPKYSSDRLSRIMGTGGPMCLSHHFDDMESLYEIGAHWDMFHDLDDLVKKCKYYLSNDDHRQKIAKEGQQHALKNYTFEKMAENIELLYQKYKK